MKNDCLTFSVVIPAYNEEHNILKALDSVSKQTYLPDEIIVVDDGSMDRTAKIVKSCGARVNYIHQDNQGLAAARNTGIRNANHEFIAFLDADDEWFPGHLQECVNVINGTPDTHWFCAAFERRTEDGDTQFVSHIDNRLLDKGVIVDYFEAEAIHAFSRPSTMIIKKSVFDEAGLFDVSISHFGEDLDMWFRIALLYPNIGYSAKPGCIYWCRRGSITSGDKIDILRFIKRISISESAAINLGTSAVQKSSRLTMMWLTKAVRYAVRQQDREAMQQIHYQYAICLPVKWRIASHLMQYKIFFKIAFWLSELKKVCNQQIFHFFKNLKWK